MPAILASLAPLINPHGFYATRVDPLAIAHQLGLDTQVSPAHLGQGWFGYSPPRTISYSYCPPEIAHFAVACGLASHLLALPSIEQILPGPHHSLPCSSLFLLASAILIPASSLHNQMLCHSRLEDLAPLFQVPLAVLALYLRHLGPSSLSASPPDPLSLLTFGNPG